MGIEIEFNLMRKVAEAVQKRELNIHDQAEIELFAKMADKNCDQIISVDEYVTNWRFLTLPDVRNYVSGFFSDPSKYILKTGFNVCFERSQVALDAIQSARNVENLVWAFYEALEVETPSLKILSALDSRVTDALHDMAAVANQLNNANQETLAVYDLECDIAMAAVREMNFATEEARDKYLKFISDVHAEGRSMMTQTENPIP